MHISYRTGITEIYPPLKYRHLCNKTLKQQSATLLKCVGREVQTICKTNNIYLGYVRHKLKRAGKEVHDESCFSSSQFSLAHYHIWTNRQVREQLILNLTYLERAPSGKRRQKVTGNCFLILSKQPDHLKMVQTIK